MVLSTGAPGSSCARLLYPSPPISRGRGTPPKRGQEASLGNALQKLGFGSAHFFSRQWVTVVQSAKVQPAMEQVEGQFPAKESPGAVHPVHRGVDADADLTCVIHCRVVRKGQDIGRCRVPGKLPVDPAQLGLGEEGDRELSRCSGEVILPVEKAKEADDLTFPIDKPFMLAGYLNTARSIFRFWHRSDISKRQPRGFGRGARARNELRL